MPSGSEFVCVNPSCRHYNSGFSMHDAWPLARIDDVLESKRAKDNLFQEGYLDGIRTLKKDGREFVCAPLPRQDDVRFCGVRVQLYCDKPPMVVDQDILCEVTGNNFIRIAVENGVATSCEQCKTPLILFREAFAKGVKCPYCGETMEGRVWHTTSG